MGELSLAEYRKMILDRASATLPPTPRQLAKEFHLALVIESEDVFNFIGEVSAEDRVRIEQYRLVGCQFNFYRHWIDGGIA